MTQPAPAQLCSKKPNKHPATGMVDFHRPGGRRTQDRLASRPPNRSKYGFRRFGLSSASVACMRTTPKFLAMALAAGLAMTPLIAQGAPQQGYPPQQNYPQQPYPPAQQYPQQGYPASQYPPQ